MASHEVEEEPQQLKHKTWVLKVSINCKGCKKKVKKVLQNVQGVYAVDVDTKQQKVTVTGNVDADTLIKKLTKSGKQAQLWPEMPDKKPTKPKNKQKKDNTESSENHQTEQAAAAAAAAASPSKQDVQPAVKAEVVQESSKRNEEANTDGKSGGAAAVSGRAPESNGGTELAKELKPDENNPKAQPAVQESPAAVPVDLKSGENEAAGGDSATQKSSGTPTGANIDNACKKKKNKGQDVNQTQSQESSGAGAAKQPITVSQNQNPGPPSFSFRANNSPPRQHGYGYPPHQYAPPPPMYAVSYNTAYPTTSQTASYYTAPPLHSYAYPYPSQATEAPPLDLDSNPRQPSDSFELFSDENPNGCSVM